MEFVGILLLFAPLGALVYYVRRTAPPGPSILSVLGIVVAPAPEAAPEVVANEPAPPQQTDAEARLHSEAEPATEAEDAAPKRMIV